MLKIKENYLKYIAAFAMLCDHFAHAIPGWTDYYLSPEIYFHCIGATAAPIFFYMLAKGYRRTRNVKKYATRLFIFAAVSYLPFILFFVGRPENFRDFFRLNVIFLMLFSLILLKILHEEKDIFLKFIGVLICGIFIIFCDWGIGGLIYILIFDYFRDNKKSILFAGIILTLINMQSDLFYVFEPAYTYDYKSIFNSDKVWNVLVYDLFKLLPFVLIYYTDSETVPRIKTKANFFQKWFFYIFYPAHLLLLYFLNAMLK